MKYRRKILQYKSSLQSRTIKRNMITQPKEEEEEKKNDTKTNLKIFIQKENTKIQIFFTEYGLENESTFNNNKISEEKKMLYRILSQIFTHENCFDTHLFLRWRRPQALVTPTAGVGQTKGFYFTFRQYCNSHTPIASSGYYR